MKENYRQDLLSGFDQSIYGEEMIMAIELKQTNENNRELEENIILSIFFGIISVGAIWFSSILLTYVVTGRI